MKVAPRLWVIILIVAVAALASGLSFWIGEPAIAFTAFLSVLVVSFMLISRGFAAYEPDASPAEFFGARSAMASQTTLQSLGSAWMMLGNVVVAGMILAQVFGIWASWVVATWWFAFILMSRRVERVRSVLQAEDTLHSFLHRAYGSRGMQRVAASITLFVGIGVFCTELVAGIALLTSVLPSPLGSVVAPLLILLLVVSMCVAAITGGLRAVIDTDSMLLRVIFGGALVLLLFAVVQAHGQEPAKLLATLRPNLDPGAIAVFLIGVTALQVPLLLGDFGTWQRIKATRRDDTGTLGAHTLRQGRSQAFLWAVPMVAGLAVLGLPAIYKQQSGNLYPSSYPLIETVRHWITAPEIPLVVRAFIIVVFLIGMLAVMVSTANSYLLIAMETFVRDILPPRRVDEATCDPVEVGREEVILARLLCAVFAFSACVPIILLVGFRINLLGVIVMVFSVQVALAPAAALALYQPTAAAGISKWVVRATLAGFLLALAFGILSNFFFGAWWASYGSFLTAVWALGVPALGIAVALLLNDGGWRSVGSFAGMLLWPWTNAGEIK